MDACCTVVEGAASGPKDTHSNTNIYRGDQMKYDMNHLSLAVRLALTAGIFTVAGLVQAQEATTDSAQATDQATPPPLLLFAGLVALPEMLGICCSTSPSTGLPELVMVARSSVTTGLAVSVSTRRISEPVTTTAFRVCALLSVAGGGVA